MSMPFAASAAASETAIVTPRIAYVATARWLPRPRAKYRREARTLPVSLARQPSRFAISALS